MSRCVRWFAAIGILALAGCAAGPDRFATRQGAVRVTAGPYLQMPGPGELVVCWQTDRPAPGEVRLARVGLKMGWQQLITSTALGRTVLQQVKLTGLEAGAAYDYAVAAGDTVTPRRRFRMPDVEADSVRFVVYGDSRADGAAHGRIARLAAESRPDFAVHTGGVVEEGGGEESYSPRLFEPAADLVASAPLFVAPGPAESGCNAFSRYFVLPGNERWYSFDIGPVHAAVLDAAAELGPESEQMQWLADDLAKAAKPWKMVFVHADALPRGAELRGLAPLFEQMKVDLVFEAGKSYARTASLGEAERGVVYISTGWGAEEAASRVALPWRAAAAGGPHFASIKASGRRLDMAVINDLGAEIDRLRLDKGAPEKPFPRSAALSAGAASP